MADHLHQQFVNQNCHRFSPITVYKHAKGIAMKFTNFRYKLLVALVSAGLMSGSAADAQVVQSATPVSYGTASNYQTATNPPAMSYESVMAQNGGCATCESAAPCGDCGCSSNGCQLGSRLGNRPELEDAKTLFGNGCEEPWLNLGGWVQGGYHTDDNNLFNSNPDRFNFHQAWFFAEKVATSEAGELGLGFRFDGMYGTDANDTQSFGNQNAVWDTAPGFTRGGGYGWALPQAYLELAKGDWNVKVGHFYTLIGYEVVTAPDNFFYSHAMTMYNSEPFTHTGVLASKSINDDTTVYGGWTLGWDTGFDQFDGGSNFLGGFSTALGEYTNMTYMTTIGDFGARGSQGYMQSLVFDMTLTENLNYVVQSDYLNVGSTGEDTFGINQYLFRTINERLSVGSRLEWWKADSLTGYAPYGGTVPATGNLSYWNYTSGLNYKINSNLVVRPEYRRDWSEGADYQENVFGIDFVMTY